MNPWMMAAKVGEMGAVKNKMPLIPQCPGLAQSAAAEMPGMAGLATLPFSTGTHETRNCISSCSLEMGIGSSKVRHSFQVTGAQKQCKGIAELGPLGWSCSWIECHSDDEQMLLHPFSLVGCQG